MDEQINSYSRRYEVPFGKLVYGTIANNLRKINGEYGNHILIRNSSEDLVLLKRDFNKKREIIKIHSKEPEKMQLRLESITGIKFSEYRIH